MKRTIPIILYAGILALWASACGPNRAIRTTLLEAENLMQQEPELALEMLEPLRPQRAKMSSSVEARYALLYSQTQDKCLVTINNDSLIRLAVNYFRNHGSRIDRARTYYYYGVIHHNARDIKGAMEALIKAQLEAEQTDDAYLQGLIYSELGNLYYEQYCFRDASEMYGLAVQIFSDCNCEENEFIALYCKSLSLLHDKQIKEATICLEKTKKLAIEKNITQIIIETEILLKDINLKQASSLARVTSLKKQLFQVYNTYTYNEIPLIHYPIFGEIYLAENNIDSARYYISAYTHNIQEVNTQNIGYFALLSSIESKAGNYAKAYEYEKLYSRMNDSINDSLRKYEVRALNQKYKNKELQASYKALMKKRRNERSGALAIIFVMALTSVIAGYRIQKRREQERAEYENYATDLRKNYTELEEKYGRLRAQGTCTPALLALLQSRMTEIQTILALSVRYINEPKTFFAEIKERTKLSANQNSQLRDEIIATANIAHNGILDYLQKSYPALTRYELCYCALIYMDFSQQSIRTLFNHTNVYSLYTIRNKIRDKLNIKKKGGNLEKYILELKEQYQEERKG